MTTLVYDGSFDGFLCAVARRMEEGASVRVAPLEGREPDLFAAEQPIVTDAGLAREFKRRFVAVAGAEELETLLLVHSSADPRRHELLLDYVELTLRAGVSVADRLGLPLVLSVQKARSRVTWEIGKLLGFVRFRRVTERFWYAPIRPEANVTGFLGPHFADRFPDEDFLIHDTVRGIGFRGRGGSGGIVDLRGMPEALRDALTRDSEPEVQSQWRAYFRMIAIPERRNPRLQDRNMPRRFRSTLVEEPGSSALNSGKGSCEA